MSEYVGGCRCWCRYGRVRKLDEVDGGLARAGGTSRARRLEAGLQRCLARAGFRSVEVEMDWKPRTGLTQHWQAERQAGRHPSEWASRCGETLQRPTPDPVPPKFNT